MTTEEPGLVSVIIPVYNGEPFLGEALESVLGQTYRPIEAIVIDDGSTDGSEEVVRRFASVRYIYQPHQGAGSARNHGLKLAQGAFVAFLDADDVWLTEKLTLQIAAFTADPQLDLVFGHVQQFRSAKSDSTPESHEEVGPAMPGLIPTTMLAKCEAFSRVGLFELKWRIGEFIDWYSRAVEQELKAKMLPNVVAFRRLHGSNLSLQEKEHRSEYVHILKQALDRRRRKGEAGSIKPGAEAGTT